MTKPAKKSKVESAEEHQKKSMEKHTPRKSHKRIDKAPAIIEITNPAEDNNFLNKNTEKCTGNAFTVESAVDEKGKGEDEENGDAEKWTSDHSGRGDNCTTHKDAIIKVTTRSTPQKAIIEITEVEMGSQEKLAVEPNIKEHSKKSNRKRKPTTQKSTDTSTDMCTKAIAIGIEEEDRDSEKAKQRKQLDDQDTCISDTKLVTKNSEEKIVDKTQKSESVETASVITVSEDSNDIPIEKKDKDQNESVDKSKKVMKTCGNQTEYEDKDNSNDFDHSIESITPTIQSDPVLENAIPVSHQDQTPQNESSKKAKNFNGTHQKSSMNKQDQEQVNPHVEDAMAAAQLMTDLAASKNVQNCSRSNSAETLVTNTSYGYGSSTDQEEFAYNRHVQHIDGRYQNQIYGHNNWHPMMFGQQSDLYWEGNFQNVAMYDCNNNLVNQGLYQNPENANFGNMGMPLRMSGSGTSQHRMPYEIDNEDIRLPLDFRQFHPMPMDYPAPAQNMPFRDVGNVRNERRPTKKIVLLDSKQGKRKMADNTESPPKRHKRSRYQVTESIADYDEIVKNLFVNAPPTNTILIQPKFMAKDQVYRTNDIDPSQVRSISHKGVVSKYIDYLLMENEYITEISKAVSLPMENCVMDDPYLMDVIRIKIPFPTPKYMQFLKDFYPSIHVDWRALNHQLDQYHSGGEGAKRFHTYYLDNRAVPVLLGEAFYFFQRESDRKAMEKTKSS